MSIESLTLRFTNPAQQLVGSQEIPLASIQQPGSKSVAITDSGILAAFNANTEGTIFTPSIAANYGNDESGNAITRVTSPASNIPSFIPRIISLASVINKTINDVPFNLSSLITTISAGALSYSSSNPSVASVNSSGQVTLLTEGITTITINVTATADHMAGSTSTTLNVTTPTPTPTPPVLEYTPITTTTNTTTTDNGDGTYTTTTTTTTAGGTIKYTGGPTLTSEPLFVYENPRGTGSEWFAVVTNSSNAEITAYAKSADSAVSAYFTKLGQSGPVLFNNIITTLVTDMTSLFFDASTFNKNISDWDISNVLSMNSMFVAARMFEQDISRWNVANVREMSQMFFVAEKFNINISGWDTRSVGNMGMMFFYASSFLQNLRGWNVTLTTDRPTLFIDNFAVGSPMSLPENSGKLPLFQ